MSKEQILPFWALEGKGFYTETDSNIKQKQIIKDSKGSIGETKMKNYDIDWEKLKKVTHYICNKASDPSVLGAIKLNKVLWYSDAIHYIHHGKSITGETYVKRQFGPVPKHILQVVDSLVGEKKIARGRVDYFGHMKSEYISIKDPENIDSALTATEINLIDQAFEHVCLKNTATSISEETHGIIWELAELGEEMPYFTVFASTVDELDESDFDWAKARTESSN